MKTQNIIINFLILSLYESTQMWITLGILSLLLFSGFTFLSVYAPLYIPKAKVAMVTEVGSWVHLKLKLHVCTLGL